MVRLHDNTIKDSLVNDGAGHPRVTHPSAAQSVKIHPKNLLNCFARLACVKHAASVHPEPGSNSLIKCLFQVQNQHTS